MISTGSGGETPLSQATSRGTTEAMTAGSVTSMVPSKTRNFSGTIEPALTVLSPSPTGAKGPSMSTGRSVVIDSEALRTVP